MKTRIKKLSSRANRTGIKEFTQTPRYAVDRAPSDGAPSKEPLNAEELRKMNAWWRAANYLSVGQIYLYDNPLLKKPLKEEHVKPRLVGHWGTTPGLNFIYVHLNRIIRKHDLDIIYIIGPGHGGPGIVANGWLEGTYSEVYPNISPDEEGMKKLFKQFSFPGGIPSHVAPETPGSIHEGGELGYALSHAFGAAFDNPDLIVATIVGDGEAETGPLATSWHSNKFLNPACDGAVLPILHLNGYKTPTRPSSHASATRNWSNSSTVMAIRPFLSKATNPRRCTRSWLPRSTKLSRKSNRFKMTPAKKEKPNARAGR
jgi:xylulose-5-phosphate/fructose-6-phosphate phosphoketolase